MTSRQLYEALLIELNKKGTTAVLLSEFNHYANKAYYQIINKEYNQYEITQQQTDSLRVIKATAALNVTDLIDDAYHEVEFPDDYLHLLKCVCIYKLAKPTRSCETEDQTVQYVAKRLTADSWGLVMENYYHKPTTKRPYYYLNNVNKSIIIPTNILENGKGTDIVRDSENPDGSNDFPRTIKLGNRGTVSTVDRKAGIRYGNASKVRCEIYCGTDNKYELSSVKIDYLKTPQTINLTQRELDLVDDESQILELPDYMCNELLNELVSLMMEKVVDPRLQTHSAITQSIAPAQQQTSK